MEQQSLPKPSTPPTAEELALAVAGVELLKSVLGLAHESVYDMLLGIQLNIVLKEAGFTPKYFCDMSYEELAEYFKLISEIHLERGL